MKEKKMNPKHKTKVLSVPYIKQKEFYCSESSVAMVLRYYGHDVSQDDVHDAGYEAIEEMIPYIEKFEMNAYRDDTYDPKIIMNELDMDRPVIVRIQPTPKSKYLHTIVIVGYEPYHWIVHDPDIQSYMRVSKNRMRSMYVSSYFAIPLKGVRSLIKADLNVPPEKVRADLKALGFNPDAMGLNKGQKYQLDKITYGGKCRYHARIWENPDGTSSLNVHFEPSIRSRPGWHLSHALGSHSDRFLSDVTMETIEILRNHKSNQVALL